LQIALQRPVMAGVWRTTASIDAKDVISPIALKSHHPAKSVEIILSEELDINSVG
jgi:hypothetical protein